MGDLDVLTHRTRKRYAHRTKAPTLVQLEGATKLGADRIPAFENLNLRIRAGQRWVVFCKERATSSALVQCVAGLQQPDRGMVTIRGHVSWPLGQVPGLSNKLSCAENSRFLLGIYGHRAQRDQELALVQELLDISREQWLSPLENQPGEIRIRLKMALSLTCDFDLYVIDSAILNKFRRTQRWSESWQSLVERRLQTRAVLTTCADLITDSVDRAKGLVLSNGRLEIKGSLAECQTLFEGSQAAKASSHRHRHPQRRT